MVPNDGLNQSELQLLVKTQTAFELVAVPLQDGGATVWTMDVVLSNGDRVMLTKARRKTECKVWKQLSALHRFVYKTVPEVERFTVLTTPLTPEQQGTDHAKRSAEATREGSAT